MPALSPTTEHVWREIRPLLGKLAGDAAAATVRRYPGVHVQQAQVLSFDPRLGRADLVTDGPGGGSALAAVDVACRRVETGARVWLAIWPPHSPLVIGRVGAETGGLRPATLVVAAADSNLNGQAADVVCTGTDDNLAIMDAITANVPSGGGSVLFLEGNYHTTGTIESEHTTFTGAGPGCVFLHDPGDATACFRVEVDGVLSNVKIQRTGTFLGSPAVGRDALAFGSGGTVENCQFIDCSVFMEEPNSTVRDCYFNGVVDASGLSEAMCDLSFSAGGIVTGCIFADVTSSAEFGDFLAFSSLIAGGTFAVVADNQIWSGTTYVGFGINVAGGTVTGNVFGGGGGADNPHFVYNAINIDPGSVVANEVYCLLDETVANGAAAIQTQTATVSANTVVLDQSSSGCCILASYFGVAVTGNSVTMQQVNAAEGIVAAWYGATVTGNAVVMGNATSQIGIHLTVDSVSCAADLNTIDTFFGITPQPTQDDGATNYVGPGNIVYDF